MTGESERPANAPDAPRWAVLGHPLLFALFPIVALLGANIEMTWPAEAFRPAAFALVATALLIIGFRLLLRSWRKAALACTLAIVAAHAVGQARLLLYPWGASGSSGSVEIAALGVWIAIVVFGLVLLRRSDRMPASVHLVLVAAAAIALAQPTYRILMHERQAPLPWTQPRATADLMAHRPTAASTMPDIYYIILDGYGRSDVLQDVYGLDEAEFVAALESDGFYIADESRSNYGQTSLSFASALNMSYLDEVGEAAGDDISQRQIARLIRFNEVSQVLHSLGYTVTALSPGYRRAELSEADTFFTPPASGVTPFEALLLESSALWGLRSLIVAAGGDLAYPGYASYRSRIEANIEQLWATPSQPGPKFVFAHLLLPHPPFVFGGDGEPLEPDLPFRAADGDQFIGSEGDYVRGYRAQVAFAHHVVEVFLDRLAEAGGNSSIVILQGDHGPGLHLDWSDPAATDTRERLSILNAIRAPGIDPTVWQPTLTPVNTFRLLFNELFGADYGRLPDRSFFSSWRAPYDFLPVEDGGAP